MNIPLLYISSVLTGAGMGLIVTLMYGIQADNVDYVEVVRNQRAEGGLASVNSFVAKAGGGVGGAITGYMLAATGYVANAAQTDLAKQGILSIAIYIPAVGMIIGTIVFALLYNIDKAKPEQITQTLREKRYRKDA